MVVENASSRVWMRWCLAGILAASPISAMPLLAYEGARAPAAPVAIRETADLSDAFKAAGEEATPQGPVLLILDIDNTLLTMPQYLGGDRWFNHHAAAIAARTDPDFSSLGELIAVQTMLFGVASMQATEPDIPAMLADARRQNIDIFLLSARGPELFDATRRELDRNGLEVEAPYACSFFLCTEDGVYRDGEIRAALAAIGEEPSRVLKSLMALVDGKPVCVIVPSDREVSMKKLASAFGGKSAQMMKPADAERLSGYKVGRISPFGQMRAPRAATPPAPPSG